MTHLIGISGGIGAGKSVVSRMLRTMGFDVYDTDSQAKVLMDADSEIKNRIEAEVAAEAIVQGKICRQILAQKVFNDSEKLARLNAIVHTAVRNDINRWRYSRNGCIFVESAIMHSSGLISILDQEWRVTAPAQIRIDRACRRSAMTPEQVEARIAAQALDECPVNCNVPLTVIINDNITPLLPQIFAALQNIQTTL